MIVLLIIVWESYHIRCKFIVLIVACFGTQASYTESRRNSTSVGITRAAVDIILYWSVRIQFELVCRWMSF